MKTKLLVMIFVLKIMIVVAQPSGFQYLGQGQFADRMSVAWSGENIYMAYYTPLNPISGSIVMKHTQNAGLSWQTSTIASSVQRTCKPTISLTLFEIVVTYMDGYETKMARSTNLGETWVISSLGRSFETSPYAETDGQYYYSYTLDLPYPQEHQSNYLDPNNPERILLPQYITNQETSMNNTPAYFWGPDVMTGVVRSNSDIVIRQAGGGTNNGWPTFYAPVITSGTVQSNPGQYPRDDVFRAGLIENAPTLDLPRPDRQTAQLVGPMDHDPNCIVMVEVIDNAYSGWLGTILPPTLEQAFVYDPYPAAPLGDPLFRNIYSVADTIWTPLPTGFCNDRSLFVNNKLWIKGEFSSQQVWSCSDTIMIIGDITLNSTPVGTVPEASTPDHVSLISEESVLMKYGYRNPEDSLRIHLARADNDPFYIYADIYAIGGTNPRSGIFSFEYQHPHPSVPMVQALDQYWTNVDLHRRKYPQTGSSPWPGNVDYPWYNPLWPERQPYMERGVIALYGSVIQSKRGFMHRAAYDQEWPSGGLWDIENDFCGGTSIVNYPDPVLGIQMATRNYPGAFGSGVGYKKDYHSNPVSSFNRTPNPSSDNPAIVWNLGMKATRWDMNIDEQIETTLYEQRYLKPIRTKVFARQGEDCLYAFNDRLIGNINGTWHDFSSINTLSLDIQAIVMAPGFALVSCTQGDMDESRIFYELNLGTLAAQQVSLSMDSMLNDTAYLPDGQRIVACYSPELQSIIISRWLSSNVLEQLGEIPLESPLIDTNLLKSSILIKPISQTEIDVLFYKYYQPHPSIIPQNQLYHLRHSIIPSSSEEPLPPVPAPELRVYPNPARGSVNLDLRLGKQSEHRIEIFNIRGQHLVTLSGGTLDTEGRVSYNWTGMDAHGNRMGSGIYLVKAYYNNRALFTKRICLF